MAVVLGTNPSSTSAQRALSRSQGSLAQALQRLSSGKRINSARDDAAGLAITERLTAQIRGLNQGVRNTNDAVSLVQTAEGAMSEMTQNLQRIRELAVQAANGTNSDSDRVALHAEASELIDEVQRIATQTRFNNSNILDGSTATLTFQVGADADETLAVSSAGNLTTTGLKQREATYIATVAGAAVTGALSSGGLVLNDVAVGASSGSSAAALAAAINDVADDSGVIATATTTVTGSAASTFTSIAANTFTINGVAVGAITGGGNAVTQGANIASAINLVAGSSGVTAVANASTGALTLTAADGSDVVVALSGTAADSATATSNRNTFLAQTGLGSAAVGTQGYGGVITTPQSPGSSNSGTFLTLPNVSGTVTDLQFSINGGAYQSLPTLNFATASGVANAHILRDAIEAMVPGYVGQFSGQLFITGGNTITFAIGGSAADLTAADANRTTLSTLTGLSNAQLGSQAIAGGTTSGTAATTRGSLTLTSYAEDGITIAGSEASNAGLGSAVGNTATTATIVENTLADVDISTQDGASAALDVLDAALDMVSSARARMGAVHNRLESVISVSENRVERLADARSRIEDADFAQETANLTRTQILQQAGTAMLAQANSLPQGVLALLR